MPDNEPAPTIETVGPLVIDRPLRVSRRADLVVQLSTDLNYSSNVLGLSNLPGGLELEAVDGYVWNKQVRLIGLVPVSGSVLLYAQAGLGHATYFDQSTLDHFTVNAGAGALFALSSMTRLNLAFSCSSERNEDFDEFYRLCQPSAAFTTAIGDPYTGTGVEFGLRGALALGDREIFARYREAAAHINFEAGGGLRFQLRPEARIRSYEVPTLFEAFDDTRTDYQASVRLGLFYEASSFSFGVAAVPRVNWSNLEQYRYWDVAGGPFLSVRF